jgi:hypothetical protein
MCFLFCSQYGFIFTFKKRTVTFPVRVNIRLLTPLVKINVIKGTVSPDIVFYLRVYEFKSVLLVRPLMVFKFVYLVVFNILKHTF